MASSAHHSRRKSIDIPPEVADLIRLKKKFTELYERNYPELQQCIRRLHHHMENFEKGFRDSTKGSRVAGIMGIAGGSAVVAGLGLALSPLIMGTSLAVSVAAAAVGGGAAIKGSRSHLKKRRQMTELRQNIEEELKTFQEKIKPVFEKMKELHEQTEKIMKDFETLGIYFDSLSNLQQEDLNRLRADMTERMRLIEIVADIFVSVSLLLDMMSVSENTRALNDMEKLAQQPRDKEMSESEMETGAGKFITGMRNTIYRLQNIINELDEDMRANI